MENILYEVPTTFEFDYFDFALNFVLMAACLTIFVKCKNIKYKDTRYEIVKIISILCFGFLLLFNAIDITSSLDMHKKIAKQYEVGNYEIVEGFVEDFVPMPYEGHGNESFEINGVKFSYSDYIELCGYNNAKSHGGVIEGNGQHLKIGYIYYDSSYGNIIVYIEQLE